MLPRRKMHSSLCAPVTPHFDSSSVRVIGGAAPCLRIGIPPRHVRHPPRHKGEPPDRLHFCCVDAPTNYRLHDWRHIFFVASSPFVLPASHRARCHFAVLLPPLTAPQLPGGGTPPPPPSRKTSWSAMTGLRASATSAWPSIPRARWPSAAWAPSSSWRRRSSASRLSGPPATWRLCGSGPPLLPARSLPVLSVRLLYNIGARLYVWARLLARCVTCIDGGAVGVVLTKLFPPPPGGDRTHRAPEFAHRGEQMYDNKIDIWAVGCLTCGRASCRCPRSSSMRQIIRR